MTFTLDIASGAGAVPSGRTVMLNVATGTPAGHARMEAAIADDVHSRATVAARVVILRPLLKRQRLRSGKYTDSESRLINVNGVDRLPSNKYRSADVNIDQLRWPRGA